MNEIDYELVDVTKTIINREIEKRIDIIDDMIMSNLRISDYRDENFQHIIELSYKGNIIGQVRVAG